MTIGRRHAIPAALGALALLAVLPSGAPAGHDAGRASASLPSTVFSRYVVGGGQGNGGSVEALVRLGRTVYAGGLFSRVSERTGSAIIVSPDTSKREPVVAEVAGGAVYASVPDGQGGWYVGGSFTSVGGLPRPGLAHLLQSGALDPFFSPADVGRAKALTFGGGTLFVGAVQDRRPRVLGLDASTGAVRPVAYPVPNETSTVTALASEGGRLFAAFDQLGGIVAYDVASGARLWTRSPVQGTEGDAGMGMAALAVTDTRLVVGGRFWDGGNRNLEVLDTATGSPLGPALTIDGTVGAVAATPTKAYATRGARILSVDLATGAVAQLAAIRAATGLVAAGTTLFIAGQTASKPPYPVPEWIYALDTTGAKRGLRQVSPALAGVAWTLSWEAGRLLVGGGFAGAGGAVRGGLAAFDARTGALLPWRPMLDGYASALAVSTRAIYVGGLFAHVNGVARPSLAAVEASGRGRLLPWSPKLGASSVYSLAAGHGRVFAGGDLRPRRRGGSRFLVAFRAGGAGSQLEFASPVHGPVTALAVWHRTLVAASDRVVAVAATGNGRRALWTQVTRKDSRSGPVLALAIRNATLYAGGRFDRIGGQPRSNLAALALDSRGAVLPFAPQVTVAVRAVVPLTSGIVFAGPDLESIASGQALGAVSIDGRLESWRVETPSPLGDVGAGTASALLPVPGGLVAGGSFTWLGPVGHQAAGGLSWLR